MKINKLIRNKPREEPPPPLLCEDGDWWICIFVGRTPEKEKEKDVVFPNHNKLIINKFYNAVMSRTTNSTAYM